ncbi:Crp/Fnr family transcriptional regulator [Tenacibaculum sp. 190524A05c]
MSFSFLSDVDIADGVNRMYTKVLEKNDFLIRSGKTCDWLAFVSSGIIRNYYMSSKDEEVTYCLTFPGNFITAWSSFISSTNTFENIHTLTNAELIILKKSDYYELISSSESWLRFFNFFTEQSYILMEDRLLSIQMVTAEQRYRKLLISNPEYVQHVPLKYIASYLGISQRHLSRLRAEISKFDNIKK